MFHVSAYILFNSQLFYISLHYVLHSIFLLFELIHNIVAVD